MSTNIDTTPILTCTFILKDEHQIFELLESINCTGVYIKKTWRRNFKKTERFLFKIIDDLQSSFRGLNILQISDMLAFKQSGEKLNCTLFNMIKLILKLYVFCLELKYLFVESNLKGICWFILTVTWWTVACMFIQFNKIKEIFYLNVQYTLPQAN